MRFILRRAGEAKGLLFAAGVAALVAVAMVTGLLVYNGQALESGKRRLLADASVEERSVLVNGSVPAGQYAERDATVRAAFAEGLGGLPVTVAVARSGTGRQITGDLGDFTPADGRPIFAAMVTLDDLAEHADLVAGSWPTAGGQPMQVALPEVTAAKLGVGIGDRVPLLDRATERRSEVAVGGLWRPRDLSDPYWRLTPELGADAGTATIGPFVLHSDDFAQIYQGSTAAAWLVTPDLSGASIAEIRAAHRDAETVTARLAEASSTDTTRASTQLGVLADRLSRADLVGRSALLTPVLLIVALSGYALILVAVLLSEDRRGQTALLRARGAARYQIASLAVREAALVALPVVLLAPLLASQALRCAGDRSALADLGLDSRPTALTWLTAGSAALGCVLALTVPAMRRGATYVEDLTSRSRPNRRAVAQRASVDIALVGLAVLAWFQLRQYSSPLIREANIDPFLAAAPVLGILAGGVIALRLLPPATGLAERLVSRKQWLATVLGMWQAGRRPHAGPVLLLALAVGVSTFAWSLVATWQKSLVDQAGHQVGAHLRIAEARPATPLDRRAQVVALPGVQTVLPAWRTQGRVGAEDVRGRSVSATVVALNAVAARDVVQLSEELADSPPTVVFDRLAEARTGPLGSDLPAGASRIAGTIRTEDVRELAVLTTSTTLLLSTPDGQIYRVPLPTVATDGVPVRFVVDLPDTGGSPLRLVGFEVDGLSLVANEYRFELTDLRTIRADGGEEPFDFGGEAWSFVRNGRADAAQTPAPNSLRVVYRADEPRTTYILVPRHQPVPVPAVVTPDVLRELGLELGDEVPILLGGAMTARIVGTVKAVPSTEGSAVLMDLPTAAANLLYQTGRTRPVTEWWIATDSEKHSEAVTAARGLPQVEVFDLYSLTEQVSNDPYWIMARAGLLAAAIGAALLAVVGLMVDVWATARRRLGELAVLNTLGAAPSLLIRSLLAEQAFLAGIGVAVGLVIGAGVGATLAPLVILTPSGDRPVPAPAFDLAWGPVIMTAVSLLAVALALSGFIALTIRRRLAAALLRIGADR
jgi:hypothetical protein